MYTNLKKIKYSFLSLVIASAIFLFSCGGSSTTPTTTPAPTKPTASDHIKGTFSITSATQDGNAISTYSSTKVNISGTADASLNFAVTSPPSLTSLPTGSATFNGTTTLSVGTGSSAVTMTLSNISATGFTATFDRTAAVTARGIAGKWVFVFTKDS